MQKKTEQFVLGFDPIETDKIRELFLKSTDAKPGKKSLDFIPKPPAIAFSKWSLDKFKVKRKEIWDQAFLKWGERLYSLEQPKKRVKKRHRTFVRLPDSAPRATEKSEESKTSVPVQKAKPSKRQKWKEESYNSYGYTRVFRDRGEGKRRVTQFIQVRGSTPSSSVQAKHKTLAKCRPTQP